MTNLTKKLCRRTTLDPRLGRREAGDVSVSLYPDNTIGFRKLKRRHEVRLTLDAVYAMALKADVLAKKRERALQRQLKTTTSRRKS